MNSPESILITGGAGFVGSSLALRFKQLFPAATVTALDNLHRRGSELNLSRLQEGGVKFQHGDIRCTEDYEQLGDFDLLIDCAAEPSVQAGVGGSPRYVLNNNLVGTMHCLEAARLRKARFVLLSTSRVYPMSTLNHLEWREEPGRFRWVGSDGPTGLFAAGYRGGIPPGRRPIVLWGEQAGLRAVASGICLRHGHAGGDQPLRSPGRTVANGQGRSGRRHLVGGKPLLPQVVALRWLRRQGQAGPRRAARRRPVRPAGNAVAHAGGLGRTGLQHRRRERGLGFACEVRPNCARPRRATASRSPRSRRPAGVDLRHSYISDSRARPRRNSAWRPSRSPQIIVRDITIAGSTTTAAQLDSDFRPEMSLSY